MTNDFKKGDKIFCWEPGGITKPFTPYEVLDNNGRISAGHIVPGQWMLYTPLLEEILTLCQKNLK